MFANIFSFIVLEVQSTSPIDEASGTSFLQSTLTKTLFIVAFAVVALISVWALIQSVRYFTGKTCKGDNCFGTSVAQLNKRLEPTGFAYIEEQDIFCSVKNPWQRKYGYCRLYDEAAAPLSMIIDSEPIYFEYDNKYWLIEFWKGQYGITTGAEIGVYNIEKKKKINDFDMVCFKSVKDKEMLPMSFTLFKNQRPIIKRNERHWWLTGFIIGEFSQPDELVMRINISFRDYEMRDAFLKGLKKVGYTDNEYSVHRTLVSVFFTTPYSSQAVSRTSFTDNLTQMKNKEMCTLYKKITDGYKTMPQKLDALYKEDAGLFNHLLKAGKHGVFFKSFDNRLNR
ncbi:MAG TPA: DUF4474 domain-containing protein [Clostridia bacterium]|nr:DUF4474 domain-containing protein [Clostridia bacterium]